jgi:simple sugar transport system ATP-binding protein
LTVLRLDGIARRFGAIQALDSVDLVVEAGQIVGVMGDNGAGKSTLLKIIAGSHPPSSGRMWLGDRPVRFAGPAQAREAGIEAVYQDLALCDNLTAAANLFLGRELRRRLLGVVPVLDHAAMERRAAQLFAELKSDARPRERVARLSGGQRQAVAIARTLLARAKLVLMDEPTAAISVRQVEEVLQLVRRLGDQGVAILLVSHRMPDIFAVCERIVVLRRGRKVADKPIAASSPQEVTGLVTGAIESA